MDDYVYNNDQVKYFTRIKEYVYERPSPQVPKPIPRPRTVLSFPLPVNLPGDVYQSMIREFELGEVESTKQVLQKGFSSASFAEQVGAALSGGAIGMGLLSLLKGDGSKIGDMAGAASVLQPIIGYGGAYFGYTRNPHIAMIFDRMGIREFHLKFALSPRDREQSQRLDEMLMFMRNQMHPELYNAFVMRYPSMFTVEFVNLNYMGVPKIEYSFLKSLSINASPQGQVFYKDGYPTMYEVDMQFVELDMRTRNSFTGAAVGEVMQNSSPPGTGGPGPKF